MFHTILVIPSGRWHFSTKQNTNWYQSCLLFDPLLEFVESSFYDTQFWLKRCFSYTMTFWKCTPILPSQIIMSLSNKTITVKLSVANVSRTAINTPTSATLELWIFVISPVVADVLIANISHQLQLRGSPNAVNTLHGISCCNSVKCCTYPYFHGNSPSKSITTGRLTLCPIYGQSVVNRCQGFSGKDSWNCTLEIKREGKCSCTQRLLILVSGSFTMLWQGNMFGSDPFLYYYGIHNIYLKMNLPPNLCDNH